MKAGNKIILKILLDVYSAEIGAIGIYMDQHHKCSAMGYEKLAEMLEKDAIDEMKHSELLAKRILFLGGVVANQKHVLPNEEQIEIMDMIKMNIDIEIDAVNRLNTGIGTCFSKGDNGSRLLLEEILKSEEAHLDVLKTIYENIVKHGEIYIVQHLM